MANFWFEDRATQRYHTHGKKIAYRRPYKEGGKKPRVKKVEPDNVVGPYSTFIYEHDFSRKIERTKTDYDNRHKTGEDVYRNGDITDLQRVDELMCEFMGETLPDKRMDSTFYYWCHETAFWVLYSMGGSYIGHKDERVQGDHIAALHEKMDKFIADVREKNPEHPIAQKMESEGYRARCHAFVDWVFVTKWRFHATG